MSSASKEKQTAASQRWRANNPIASLLKNARQRARRAGLEFSVAKADVDAPDYCPILGLQLVYPGACNGRCDASASLDRIDPKKGYTPENVRVISWRANRLKSDAELWEIKAIARFMEEHNG